jgi:hypothetical protein
LTSILQVSVSFNLLSPHSPAARTSSFIPPPNPWIPRSRFSGPTSKMKRPTLLTSLLLHLLLLSVPSVSAVCNGQTARPIDGELLVLIGVDAAFIEEVGQLIAGAAYKVKRRNAVPVQIRDVFSCTRLTHSIHWLILGLALCRWIDGKKEGGSGRLMGFL